MGTGAGSGKTESSSQAKHVQAVDEQTAQEARDEEERRKTPGYIITQPQDDLAQKAKSKDIIYEATAPPIDDPGKTVGVTPSHGDNRDDSRCGERFRGGEG